MRVLSCLAGLLLSSSAFAGVTSVDLSNYQLTATHSLPPVSAAEASSITYNWDTHTLFVLGDEGDALAEVSTTGQLISEMTLIGFDDTEGLTYIGNGPNFMVKSIAEQNGIKMPSFFGYIIRFTFPILLPILFLIWLVFFAFA